MSSQLQHKLSKFEATPPKDTWLAIEDRLNNTPIQERLYDFETTPPATAWNAIETILNQTPIQESKSTSITRRKWFRVTIAAAILGVIALGILTFAVQKPDEAIAKQPYIKKQQTALPSTHSTPSTNTATEDKNAETIIPIKEESISVPASSSERDQTATITKRYKVVAKEDGQIVRLSQKAYAVFDCAIKGAEQRSENCKENIQTMQAKMATSLASPTTDFAGLINMIKTLEENK